MLVRPIPKNRNHVESAWLFSPSADARYAAPFAVRGSDQSCHNLITESSAAARWATAVLGHCRAGVRFRLWDKPGPHLLRRGSTSAWASVSDDLDWAGECRCRLADCLALSDGPPRGVAARASAPQRGPGLNCFPMRPSRFLYGRQLGGGAAGRG